MLFTEMSAVGEGTSNIKHGRQHYLVDQVKATEGTPLTVYNYLWHFYTECTSVPSPEQLACIDAYHYISLQFRRRRKLQVDPPLAVLPVCHTHITSEGSRRELRRTLRTPSLFCSHARCMFYKKHFGLEMPAR